MSPVQSEPTASEALLYEHRPDESVVCNLCAHRCVIRYVYTGNVPGDAWENTQCPGCSKCVVRRRGFEVLQNRVSDGRCPDCATPIAGIWR